jgi:hypothetical protein
MFQVLISIAGSTLSQTAKTSTNIRASQNDGMD